MEEHNSLEGALSPLFGLKQSKATLGILAQTPIGVFFSAILHYAFLYTGKK